MHKPVSVKKAVRLILFVIPLAVLGNVIYTAAYSGQQGFKALTAIPWGWLALALFLSLAPWIFAMLRLAVWGRFFKLGLTTRDCAEIVLANDVAAAATPTAIGGGYAKLGLLVFHGVKPGVAASIMVIGSIEEYAVLSMIVPICWYFAAPPEIEIGPLLDRMLPSTSAMPVVLPAAVVSIALITLVLYMIPYTRRRLGPYMTWTWWREKVFTPIGNTIRDFKGALVLISRGGKLAFCLNMLFAAAQWIMRYSIFTAIAFGFGLSPDPVQFFLVQWLLFTILNIVPTPGAIGGAELGFALLFRNLVPPNLLPVAGGAWRFITTYLQLMIAAALMVYLEKPSLKKKKTASPQSAAVPVTIIDNSRGSQGVAGSKAAAAPVAKSPGLDKPRL